MIGKNTKITQVADAGAMAAVHQAPSLERIEATMQQRRRERVRRERVAALIYPIGMMVVFLLLWELATRVCFSIPALFVAGSERDSAVAAEANSAILITQSVSNHG